MKKSDPGIELVEGTHLVSAGPCGVVSIILSAAVNEQAYVKLYDVAATGDISVVIKTLNCGGVVADSVVYCPCKSDSFAVGCVAKVGGHNALASVSIES